MKIAIDFDNTIHDRTHMKPGYKMGEPYKGAKSALWHLVEEGHKLYILTASTDARMQSIRDWLEYFKFPPVKVTNVKEDADLYIDDKAITFTNWADVMEKIK